MDDPILANDLQAIAILPPVQAVLLGPTTFAPSGDGEAQTHALASLTG